MMKQLTGKRGKRMNIQKIEEIRDTAIKLNAIRLHSPEDYGYLKGWIHCLLQRECFTDKKQEGEDTVEKGSRG